MTRIEELKAEMASNGIYPAGDIHLRSDRMERIRSFDGKRGNSDIFLRYDPVHDSVMYGDWKEGGKHYVYRFMRTDDRLKSVFDMLPFFMRDNRKTDTCDEAFLKAYATTIVQCNAPASFEHPYLDRKRVMPHSLRQSEDGLLIVPVYNGLSEVVGVQFIAPDGSKRFMRGSRMNGGHLIVGGMSKGLVFIVEGFATGASVTEQTGMLTYIAFSAGNLTSVARMVKERHPAERIIIIADNDSSGTGQTKAREAAVAAGVEYVVIPTEGWDANDYVNNGGDIMRLIKEETR